MGCQNSSAKFCRSASDRCSQFVSESRRLPHCPAHAWRPACHSLSRELQVRLGANLFDASSRVFSMSYQQIRGHALRSGELGANRMEQNRQNCLRVTYSNHLPGAAFCNSGSSGKRRRPLRRVAFAEWESPRATYTLARALKIVGS